MNEPVVRAGNGTVVEAGGVYLTFSGDPARPYLVVKLLRVRPSAGDLWLKAYGTTSAERPAGFDPAQASAAALWVSVEIFLAWGPPTFPIRLATDPVTAAELAARTVDGPPIG